MKARLHPTTAMQKAIDAYAEAKIQGIQSSAQEAVMKESAAILPPAPPICVCWRAIRSVFLPAP